MTEEIGIGHWTQMAIREMENLRDDQKRSEARAKDDLKRIERSISEMVEQRRQDHAALLQAINNLNEEFQQQRRDTELALQELQIRTEQSAKQIAKSSGTESGKEAGKQAAKDESSKWAGIGIAVASAISFLISTLMGIK